MKALLGSRLLSLLANASDATLARSLAANLRDGRHVALCFHRVSDTRTKLAMPAAEIDRLIGFLREARVRTTVCFDDGYRDAAEYVLSRAPVHAPLEWLFFVCPRKTERQQGFAWDADGSELADLELVKDLQRLPNVALGNHTNLHERATLLPGGGFRLEAEESKRDFERLFGPQRHFAFPFGVPQVDFTREHVSDLRTLGDFLIWTTEPRPFHPRERRPRALLPRFCIDGRRTWKESAVHIALHAMRTRLALREERA